MRFFSARLNLDKGILLNFKFFLVNLFQYKTAAGRPGQVRGQENESLGLIFLSAELVKQKAELKVGSEVQGGDKRGDKLHFGMAEG